jgi:transposase
MVAGVVLRADFSAVELRAVAAKTKDAKQARRLLSLAAVYEGRPRAEAAALGGMDRQTLRDWAHRFNAVGPDGLLDGKSPGRPATLSAEHAAELERLVQAGPDPEEHGVVRWRCTDLKREFDTRFGLHVSASSLRRMLKKLGYSYVSARPRHPGQKPEAVETFKKTSPAWQPGL